MSPSRVLQLLAALGMFASPVQRPRGNAAATPSPAPVLPAGGPPLRASLAPPAPRQAHRQLAARSTGLQRARGHRPLPDEPGTPGHDEGHASVVTTGLLDALGKSARAPQDPLILPHYAPPTAAQALDGDALKRHPSAYKGPAAHHRDVTFGHTTAMGLHARPSESGDREDS